MMAKQEKLVMVDKNYLVKLRANLRECTELARTATSLEAAWLQLSAVTACLDALLTEIIELQEP
jgi:hypothetical protein